MKAICHIGFPKTGSKTIQEFLHLNATALQQQGFLYRRFRSWDPMQVEYVELAFRKVRRNFDDIQHRLRFGVPSQQKLDAQADDIETWFSKERHGQQAHTWLISSEVVPVFLSGRPGATALHEWMSSQFDSVTYVLYLRRQDLWAASEYSQHLRHGHSSTLEEYLAGNRGFNYMKLYRLWASIAGADRITVRLLEADALKNKDLLEDYCDIAGIDIADLARPQRHNESFSRRGAELVRRVNALTARFFEVQSKPSRVIRKAGQVIAQTMFGGGKKIRLSDTERGAILARFAQSNENLRRACFPDRATLFEMPAAAPTSQGAPRGATAKHP